MMRIGRVSRLVRSGMMWAVLLVGFVARPVHAATEFTVLFDLDQNALSGCTVATVDGPFAGVEQRLITTISTFDPLTVVSVVRQVCTAGPNTWGPTIPVSAPFPPSWPVGVANGTGGLDVIETYLPLAGLPPGVYRVGFTSALVGGGAEDALITTTGTGAGSPILIANVSSVGVPALDDGGRIGLVLLLFAAGLILLRHGRTGAGAWQAVVLLTAGLGVAYATLTPDGDPSGWATTPPLASDAPPAAPANIDIGTVFGTVSANTLLLRIDADLVVVEPAKIVVTPTTYDFGKVLVGSTVSHTFTIQNTGGVATSAIDAVAVNGDANFPGFTNDTCFTAILAPNDTCSVDVVFKPLALGAASATLSINASVGGMATANLSGFGAKEATLSISPSASQDFGNVLQNTTSATRIFTVQNTGDLPSGTLGVVATGDALGQWPRSDDNCTGQTLAAGATCTFKAAFNPNGTGSRSGAVGVTSAPGGTADTPVSGVGVATAASLQFDPTSRAFNALFGPGSLSTPVYITNSGAADSGPFVFEAGTPVTGNISNIEFQGGIPNGSPHPPCGTMLPGNSTCGGFMTFTASAAQADTKVTLKVTANPGGTSSFTATFD